MPTYNNQFASPKYIEETILDAQGKTIGTIRIKPSSVLWKPANAHKYLAVTLEEFTQWIQDPNTGAKKVNQ